MTEMVRLDIFKEDAPRPTPTIELKMHGEENVIMLKVMGLDEIRLKWW